MQQARVAQGFLKQLHARADGMNVHLHVHGGRAGCHHEGRGGERGRMGAGLPELDDEFRGHV